MRRVFRIYTDCPAIACDHYLKGVWRAGDSATPGSVIERIASPKPHLTLTSVQFFDISDRRNTMVHTRTVIPYRFENPLVGNLFLENRYTDAYNYYPHWTLRNLWMLSRYVPPQSLQIEFLNKWRNPDKYPAGDPLAPSRVPFDYCFAVTMMAQPLGWFEAAYLPEEAFAAAPLIKQYRLCQERIHSGQIFPIGDEPSGTGWMGFQSIIDDQHGYLLIFRELNDQAQASLGVWNLACKRVQCRHVLGHGADFAQTVSGEGKLAVQLPGAFTFALYEYAIV